MAGFLDNIVKREGLEHLVAEHAFKLEIACAIDSAMKEQGISVEDMAEKLGWSDRKLNRLLRGDSNSIGDVAQTIFVLGLRALFSTEPVE